MTKKVLMLQMVDKASGNSSIEFMVSQLLSGQDVNFNYEKVYNIEFKYYSDNVNIEEMTPTSIEMSTAVKVSNMLIDYMDEGNIKFLDN